MKSRRGFTPIELMIVVTIIGILAAIAIPNFLAMKTREKENAVWVNLHIIRTAMEDFNVLSNGSYPTSASSTTPSGDTLRDLCPDSRYPTNPFTGAETPVAFGRDADATRGAIAITPATSLIYVIMGRGYETSTYLPVIFLNF